MKPKPNPIFVDVTILADRGRAKDLKAYFDAAEQAVMQLAGDERVFCGIVGRRAIVSRASITRRMNRYGFYGKEKR